MHERGFLTLGRLFGVRVRMHVLTILGALVFTGFRFEPGAWAGFFLLILLHEAGHALLVRRYKLAVVGIDLHIFGGVCRWSGTATEWQRAVIAWGGVLAQAVVFAAAVAVSAVAGPFRSPFAADLVSVFTTTNLFLVGLNLLPIAPLDGAEAWGIVGPLRRRGREALRLLSERRARAKAASPRSPRPSAPAPRLPPHEAARIARAFEDAVRKR